MTESLMMDNIQEKNIPCVFNEDYLPNPNKRECSPSMPPAEPTIKQRLRRFIKSIFYYTPLLLLISFSFSGKIPFGKIEFKDGTIIECRNIEIYKNSLTFESYGKSLFFKELGYHRLNKNSISKDEVKIVWGGFPRIHNIFLYTICLSMFGLMAERVGSGFNDDKLTIISGVIGISIDGIQVFLGKKFTINNWKLVWKNKSLVEPTIESTNNDYIEELRRLNQLKVDGIITDEEFELKKKQLLKLD